MNRFWIRKDRERYLLGGVIAACMIGGFVSSRWHLSDRIQSKKNIKIRYSEQDGPRKRPQEVQLAPQQTKDGVTRYYKLGPETNPVVPKLGEKDEN